VTDGFQYLCCVADVSWTDRARNGEVLLRIKEERNIVQTINRRKANRNGHILRRELPPKIRYLGKGRGEDTSDEKTSKKR
jgi:hypothetical protein